MKPVKELCDAELLTELRAVMRKHTQASIPERGN
jgi:hypothetical protein